MAQMQLLGHVLDKVKRQILEDKEDLALSEVRDTLTHYYDMTEAYLSRTPIDIFLLEVKQRQYEAEELRMLAAFIDELAGLMEDDNQRKALWHKVVALYDLLEQEYKVFSFDHVSRRQLLMKALE